MLLVLVLVLPLLLITVATVAVIAVHCKQLSLHLLCAMPVLLLTGNLVIYCCAFHACLRLLKIFNCCKLQCLKLKEIKYTTNKPAN